MKYLAPCLLALFWMGCKTTSPPSTMSDSETLASFEGGRVTKNDLESAILELPPEALPKTGTLEQSLREKLIKKIALETIVLEQALAQGWDGEPGFKKTEHDLMRQIFGMRYLNKEATPQEMTEEGLQAFFQERASRYHLPEKRHIWHIFRRAGDNPAQTQELMQDLRRRMIAGENWADLARDYSHSESRHKGGDLGLVLRGQFSQDFDAIVFGLEKGVPSQPIKTQDGFHLFFIQSSIEALKPELQDIRPRVLADFQRHLLKTQREQIVGQLPLAENAYKEDRQTLQQIIAMSDPTLELFRMGSYRLDLITFKQLLIERQAAMSQESSLETIFDLFDEIWDMEQIFQYLEAEGRLDRADLQFQKMRHQKLVQYALIKHLNQTAQTDEAKLRQHYQNNIMRFATPLVMNLTRFTLALNDTPSQQMARLEQMRTDFSNKKISQAFLVETTGGKLQPLKNVTPAKLQALDPRALKFVANLNAGEVSPPYRLGSQLIMLFMDARVEPVAQPFEAVKAMVINDFLQQKRDVLFENFSQNLLAEKSFNIH